MSFIALVLTVFLLVNSLLLILLVLVQLPKKDAGAGLAFGGGAADALFGAGSGNALTKITKWATGIFIAVTILLGIVQDKAHQASTDTSAFSKSITQKEMQAPATPAQSAPAPSTTPLPANNNSGFSTAPLTTNTAASTNTSK